MAAGVTSFKLKQHVSSFFLPPMQPCLMDESRRATLKGKLLLTLEKACELTGMHSACPGLGPGNINLFLTLDWVCFSLSIGYSPKPCPSKWWHLRTPPSGPIFFRSPVTYDFLIAPEHSPDLGARHAQLVTHEALPPSIQGLPLHMGTSRKVFSKKETSSAHCTINYTQQHWCWWGKKKKTSQRKKSLNSHSCRQARHLLLLGFLLWEEI